MPAVSFASSASVLLLILTFAVFLSCAAEPPNKAMLKVGLGEKVITPDEPVRMRGFARSQVSTGVHDDLFARSLVIEDIGGSTVVLMTVAMCGLTEDYAEKIRAIIEEKTAIPPENVIISCTHTHAGPNVGSSHDTFNKEEVDRTMASLEYRAYLIEQSAASAVEAWENRVPGKIGIEATEVFNLGMNRRRLLYGGLHPDPEVAVIKIEDAAGKLLGVAFNYGCHPSGLDWRNTLISEDWPYYTIRGIKEKLGEDVWVAYYQSAEGDINLGYNSELSAIGADMPIRNYEYIEKKGRLLINPVLDALPSIASSGTITVSTSQDRFDYPLRKTYPVTLAEAEALEKAAKDALAKAKADPALKGTRILDDAIVEDFQSVQRLRFAQRFYGDEQRPATRSLEQQAVRIGDSVFVTYPGELFSEIGLAIKNGSPVEKTFIIGLTSGPGGYLPSAREFVEGDYEVNGSAYSAETEAVCVQSSLSLIGRVSD